MRPDLPAPAPAGLPGRGSALLVCGTASDSGKSTVVAGLCRALARRGVSVAPFKAQNMALNSAVTADGAEIGRAQAFQAAAAGIEPEVAMNPVLLKPTGERTSQVVVGGRPWAVLGAVEYQAAKAGLRPVVLAALADLRHRFDVVLCEGAGSPAEPNLARHDLVNLWLAAAAGLPALVVGDIDRGGVFAHLYGTWALLPPERRALVRGFVLNKFRGDPALLDGALTDLRARCGVPTLGVLPHLGELAVDAEDSMALSRSSRPTGGAAGTDAGAVEVAVVRFPRISNFTDLDALALEPGVRLHFVDHPSALGRPDLVVLPGTKATVDDLGWMRRRGLAAALGELLAGERPPAVLGICGGYQMMGRRIEDPGAVESPVPATEGLGWLDVATAFEAAKVTRRRRGNGPGGVGVAGYEIHHGRPVPGPGAVPWLALEAGSATGTPGPAEPEGVADPGRALYGTSLHGLLEGDGFREWLLSTVAARRGGTWRPSGVSFEAARQAQLDRLADACEAHLDLDALWALSRDAAPPPPPAPACPVPAPPVPSAPVVPAGGGPG